MLLIADSGSTKTDWALIHNGQARYTGTIGFNPLFHSSDLISSEISKNMELFDFADEVTRIRFFGAGCSSKERNAIVEEALHSVFPNADDVMVREDMLGAAIALCGDQPGIVCILGTGSNACYFDGDEIVANFPSLGYILGDEGSGSYFGKDLLAQYLYGNLPNEIAQAVSKIGMNKDQVLQRVYNEPNANVFLASIMKLIEEKGSHPWVRSMIKDGFTTFAKTCIQWFDNYTEHQVHFLGSVAYFNCDVLEEVADEMGFSMGDVIRQPIYNLAEFYG